MKILAIELATAQGSLAWVDDNEEVIRQWPNDRKNSGAFFENLANLHKKHGSPEIIIVGLGPGSYAGTRIAISAAIGLSFGGTTSVSSQDRGPRRARPSIQLVGYPSICAMETNEREYFVIGDARRQSFFFANVRDNALVAGPALLSEMELTEKLSLIDPSISIFASEELPQFDRMRRCYPSAKVLARLAAEQNRTFVVPPLEPMYLREPHITIPKSKL